MAVPVVLTILPIKFNIEVIAFLKASQLFHRYTIAATIAIIIAIGSAYGKAVIATPKAFIIVIILETPKNNIKVLKNTNVGIAIAFIIL